jgi:TolA-binding protein
MWGLAAVAAAGLALFVGARLWRERSQGTPATPSFRAAVQPLGTASFVHERAAEEEWVRLTEGEVRVQVQPLHKGERFRVISSDGEVEVRGTVFNTKVLHDHLYSVTVVEGHVDVRRHGGSLLRLGPGERWEAETPSLAPPPAGRASVAPPGPSRPPHLESPPKAVGERTLHRSTLAKATLPPAPIPAERAFAEGWGSLRRGQFEVAASAFDRAVATGAGEPILEDARFWRAVALARADRRKAAIAALRDFIARHPTSPRFTEASSILGWQLVKEGMTKEAEQRFQAAAQASQPAVRESARAGLGAIAAQRASKVRP